MIAWSFLSRTKPRSITKRILLKNNAHVLLMLRFLLIMQRENTTKISDPWEWPASGQREPCQAVEKPLSRATPYLKALTSTPGFRERGLGSCVETCSETRFRPWRQP